MDTILASMAANDGLYLLSTVKNIIQEQQGVSMI